MPSLSVIAAGESHRAAVGTVADARLHIAYIIVALSTIVFPGVNVLLLRWYGAVSSLDVRKRRERFAPYISSFFFFVLGYMLLRRGALPATIEAVMPGTTVTLILLAVINSVMKISAHAAGAGGFAGTVVALSMVYGIFDAGLIAGAVLMTGFVVSARLILGVHTPREAYLGAGIGFCTLFIFVFLGLTV